MPNKIDSMIGPFFRWFFNYQVRRSSVLTFKNRVNGYSLFLFGSILAGSLNSDIDLLCVYDPARISPKDVYGKLKPLFRGLENDFGAHIHPVILTESEEKQVRFVQTEGCVLIVK